MRAVQLLRGLSVGMGVEHSLVQQWMPFAQHTLSELRSLRPYDSDITRCTAFLLQCRLGCSSAGLSQLGHDSDEFILEVAPHSTLYCVLGAQSVTKRRYVRHT